jgi:hypothetical protein
MPRKRATGTATSPTAKSDDPTHPHPLRPAGRPRPRPDHAPGDAAGGPGHAAGPAVRHPPRQGEGVGLHRPGHPARTAERDPAGRAARLLGGRPDDHHQLAARPLGRGVRPCPPPRRLPAARPGAPAHRARRLQGQPEAVAGQHGGLRRGPELRPPAGAGPERCTSTPRRRRATASRAAGRARRRTSLTSRSATTSRWPRRSARRSRSPARCSRRTPTTRRARTRRRSSPGPTTWTTWRCRSRRRASPGRDSA